MKIYTKTGDEGMTGAVGGRLGKDDVRVEAYGTIDEMNTSLGLAISFLGEEQYADIKNDLLDIQQNLFMCCSDMATLDTSIREYRMHEEHLEKIEKLIDHHYKQTEAPEYFIIPGGTQCAAALHVCRTVTRRAERRVVALEHQEEVVNPVVKKFLNRLSDLFFVLARVCNARAGVPDIQHIQGKKVFRSGKE